MLTTFLLTMRATPYYYSGDELGMTNIKFDTIDDYQDIEPLQLVPAGEDVRRRRLQKFLEGAQNDSARQQSHAISNGRNQ